MEWKILDQKTQKQSMVVEFRVVNISKVAVVSGKEFKVELWGR